MKEESMMFKLSKRNIITTLLVSSVVVSGVAFSFANESASTNNDGTGSVKEEYSGQRRMGKRFGGQIGGFCEEGLSQDQIESLKTLREEHREEMLGKVSELKGMSVDELKEKMEEKREEMKRGMKGRMGKRMMNKNHCFSGEAETENDVKSTVQIS
jgi:hypothetical protein